MGGQLWWMWVFSTAQVTVYAIEPGRGLEQAARVLGADFAGFLVRDGWAVYRRFLYAMHQSCLAHLLRRCRERMRVGGKRLEARLDQSLQRCDRSSQNRRLANHLLRERDALFAFLNCPGLEATNWRAEQAIRPMVVARKVWGGNRTARGAQIQSILVSFLQTCRQQLRPASSLLQSLLCSSQPKIMDLAAPTR